MKKDLRKLLREAKSRIVTDSEYAAQRISFAYGNAKMADDRVTREMVEKVADEKDRNLTLAVVGVWKALKRLSGVAKKEAKGQGRRATLDG